MKESEEKGLCQWSQGCGRPMGSRSARLRHLACHSPVAKSPWAEMLTFVHLCGVPSVLRDSLRGSLAVSNLARFDPAKPWEEGLRNHNEGATKRAFSLFYIF